MPKCWSTTIEYTTSMHCGYCHFLEGCCFCGNAVTIWLDRRDVSLNRRSHTLDPDWYRGPTRLVVPLWCNQDHLCMKGLNRITDFERDH